MAYHNITIFNSTLNNNKAEGENYYGGVIFQMMFEGNIIISYSTFINNSALNGGVIYKLVGTPGNVNLTNSVLINNTASSNGGVIYAPNIIDVSNNWWGNNTPFSVDDNLIFNITGGSESDPTGEFISPSNHLILNLTVDPTTLNSGEVSDVKVEFHDNLTGDIVSIPSRVLSLSSNGGSFNPTSTDISSNITSVFTAGNNAGEYNINANVDNETLSKNINVINSAPPVNPIDTVLIGEDITTNQTSVDFTVTLKTVNGTVLPDESVLYILYNDEYHPVTTDTNGVATITLNNLSIGSYTIRYVYFGNSIYASSNGSNTVTVTNTSKVDSTLKVDFTANTLNFNLSCNGTPLNGQNITINVNGTNITLTTDKEGLAKFDLSNYTTGNYTVTYSYLGTGDIKGVNGSVNVTVTNTTTIGTVLSLNNFTETYGQGLNLTGKLLNLNGKPIIGMYIALNLTNPRNGASKIYHATTDDKGEYQLTINLYPGEYTAKATYEGLKINNTIYLASGPVNGSIHVDKISTNLTVNKFNETFNAGQNLTGKLLNSKGEAIIGQYISLNLTRLSDNASKIYYATTDDKGEYQLAINLFAGEYTAQCSYAGTNIYETSNAGTSISVRA